MTVSQFDNGYWYATEVKAFAKEIGVPDTSRLRKDELELIVRHYLKTGALSKPKRKLATQKITKDVDRGLSLKRPVRRYTNDRKTKEFLVESAKKIDKQFREKSGARYRLNRWRDLHFRGPHYADVIVSTMILVMYGVVAATSFGFAVTR